jgi:hypothetical protein
MCKQSGIKSHNNLAYNPKQTGPKRHFSFICFTSCVLVFTCFAFFDITDGIHSKSKLETTCTSVESDAKLLYEVDQGVAVINWVKNPHSPFLQLFSVSPLFDA